MHFPDWQIRHPVTLHSREFGTMDYDDDVQKIELTVIHKDAEPSVWERLGLWPDQDEEDFDEEDC